jgi:rubrerythrin
MSPVAKSVLEGLNKGIQAELAAYVFYRKAMDVAKDEKVKEILG